MALAPVEIEALLQSAEQADSTVDTIEMVPLERPIVDSDDAPRRARGSSGSPATKIATQRGMAVTPATRVVRSPLRRARATLRVEEIVPPKKR